MGTRAQIIVKGNKAKLYKHWDGYPEGVLPFLEKFTREFIAHRGADPEYYMGQIMRHWQVNDPENFKSQEFTGFGIDTVWHGDIEFIYQVDLDAEQIVIRETKREWWDKCILKNTVIAKIIDLEPAEHTTTGADALARVYKIGGVK